MLPDFDRPVTAAARFSSPRSASSLARRVLFYNSSMAHPTLKKSLPFAWHGMQVELPPEWNLHSFRGTFRKGALLFSDLRQPRLHIRWKSHRFFFRKAAKPLEHDTARMRRRQPDAVITHLSAGAIQAVQFDLPSTERLVLLADATRFYELHWPDAPPPSAATLITHFRDALDHPPATDHFWNVYGARGAIPARARLRHAALLPGSTYLHFTHQRRLLMVGALSMADRLLDGAPLRPTMERELRLLPLKGLWEESPAHVHFQGYAHRRFGSPLPFEFRFSHDALANQLVWELTTTRRFLKLWKPL